MIKKTMELFKQFSGPTYFLTNDLNELSEEAKNSILSRLEIDFSIESIIATCGIDDWTSRGVIWAIVTSKRVASQCGNILNQNLLVDITGVERKGLNIEVSSPGNKTKIFSWLSYPSEKLIEKFFMIIQKEWTNERDLTRKKEISNKANQIDYLERLVKLLEAGHISRQEFNNQKEKILDQ